MANVVRNGFTPWGTISGGEGVLPSPMRAEVANNYGTGIFLGDIVTAVSDGTVAASSAADNGKLIGVVVGCSYVLNGKRQPSTFVPASTTFTPTTVGSENASWVFYQPLTADLILLVDADDGTTVTTIAAGIGLIQENCDIATGSGDTTTGYGAMLLDISTHATTTANFRIIDVLRTPDNDLTLTHAKYLVVCNEGILPPYTASGI